jgi:cyclic dehypoxanthinyl futalosine synthase
VNTKRTPARPLRVSAVSFLNGRPLYHSLVGDKAPTWDDGAAMFQIELDLPSVCADRLERGEVDVGLVPVAAYAAHPEWEVVPGIGIGCRGPVETVVVASRVPLEQVERIWLDEASRTSVILLQLILRARGLSPRLEPAPHGDGERRIAHGGEHDAALIIGDAAFDLQSRFEHVLDLGDAWFSMTGLPMVFAFWAARPGVLTGATSRPCSGRATAAWASSPRRSPASTARAGSPPSSPR